MTDQQPDLFPPPPPKPRRCECFLLHPSGWCPTPGECFDRFSPPEDQ
jgi:hypothetical protein